jgi:hypothetical protein
VRVIIFEIKILFIIRNLGSEITEIKFNKWNIEISKELNSSKAQEPQVFR